MTNIPPLQTPNLSLPFENACGGEAVYIAPPSTTPTKSTKAEKNVACMPTKQIPIASTNVCKYSSPFIVPFIFRSSPLDNNGSEKPSSERHPGSVYGF